MLDSVKNILLGDHGGMLPLTMPVLLILGLLVALTLHSILTSTPKKNGSNGDGLVLPPMGASSVKEFGGILAHPDSSQILLDKCREMKLPAFQVPLPSFLRLKLFFVTDHILARQILEDPTSTKTDFSLRFFKDTTDGPNLITANGHRWKHVRKSTMAAFSNKNVKKMVEVINDITDRWVKETLEPALSAADDAHNGDGDSDGISIPGQGIDILKEMTKVTANVIAEAAFDYTFTDDERITFLHNLRKCWDEYAVKNGPSIIRKIPYLRYIPRGMREARQASKELLRQCRKMMDAYRAKVSKGGDSARETHKLIDMILYDDEYESDEERIRDMVAYVIAGFDTTANTISFALLELARHPQEQTKLRAALQRYEREEDARNCIELKHVIRETLRLRPAASLGSGRALGRDFKISSTRDGNMTMPSKSAVLLFTYAIQRDADIFTDPDIFLPSRWENPSVQMTKSMTGFSLGPRNCQGQALAYAEATEILLRLCRDYEIRLVEEGRAMTVVLYKPVGTILSFARAERSI